MNAPAIFSSFSFLSDMNQSLNNLRLELIKHHQISADISRHRGVIRPILISKIEGIILEVVKKISIKQAPKFESINFNKFDNFFFEDRLRLKDSERCKKKIISFGKANTRFRFSVIIFLLSKIHKLLASGKICTRRELYYGNLDIFKSQSEVDEAMVDICYILDAPTWELGVLATAKGMVAGPLIFKINDDVIDCNRAGGVLIPQNILEAELISSYVQWALVIEKDAAFQSILDGNGLTKFKDCLFITGKGFPDVNTRLLICRLWETFKIPILTFVDADPYGIEIMCMYRFGSLRSSSFSDRLACPAVRWLGVHPSDIKGLSVDFASLSENDIRRVTTLANRPYVKENEKILKEVQILIDDKKKAEIEGISGISPHYMIDVYIPSKIQCGEFI